MLVRVVEVTTTQAIPTIKAVTITTQCTDITISTSTIISTAQAAVQHNELFISIGTITIHYPAIFLIHPARTTSETK